MENRIMKELKHAYKDGWVDSFNNQDHDKESFELDWESSTTKNQPSNREPSIPISKLQELIELSNENSATYEARAAYNMLIEHVERLIDENSND